MIHYLVKQLMRLALLDNLIMFDLYRLKPNIL